MVTHWSRVGLEIVWGWSGGRVLQVVLNGCRVGLEVGVGSIIGLELV